MSKTSWRVLIGVAMDANKEGWDQVVSSTLDEAELDVSFDDGYGVVEGKPFCLWTVKRVYFPVVYDGAEWVHSVSRNPDGNPAGHFGGE